MSEELKQAIDDAGGATAIAGHFSISPVSVYEWISRGCVPADKCPEIEKFSGGKVRCEQLNDKVDWAYVRSTKAA
jgi:DNA-binding transcriptional regulator YdaS (Cro superfamily)